jgi:hypothetical protein
LAVKNYLKQENEPNEKTAVIGSRCRPGDIDRRFGLWRHGDQYKWKPTEHEHHEYEYSAHDVADPLFEHEQQYEHEFEHELEYEFELEPQYEPEHQSTKLGPA